MYAYRSSGPDTAHPALHRAYSHVLLIELTPSTVSSSATNSLANPLSDTPTPYTRQPLTAPQCLSHRRPHNRPHRRRLPQERVQGERDRRRPRRPASPHRRPIIAPTLRRAAPWWRRLGLRLRQEPGLRRRSARSGAQAVGYARHRLGRECLRARLGGWVAWGARRAAGVAARLPGGVYPGQEGAASPGYGVLRARRPRAGRRPAAGVIRGRAALLSSCKTPTPAPWLS